MGSHAFSFCVRQDYEELEKQLKEVFKERSTILRQLTKTSRELDGIKVNLQVRWRLISQQQRMRNHLCFLGGLTYEVFCILYQFWICFWACPWELLFITILTLKRKIIWCAVWESVVCKLRNEKTVCLAKPSILHSI